MMKSTNLGLEVLSNKNHDLATKGILLYSLRDSYAVKLINVERKSTDDMVSHGEYIQTYLHQMSFLFPSLLMSKHIMHHEEIFRPHR